MPASGVPAFWVLAFRVLALTLLVSAVASGPAAAAGDELRIAVASNFVPTAREVAALYEATSGDRVVIVSGSTGKHYAQIRNGARLDAFLAADAARPERLENDGLAVSGSRFTYAVGRLVLWGGGEAVDEGLTGLGGRSFRHLAIARPELAPYGRAAREALEASGVWESVERRLVWGENVAQAFQFVASGNAEVGLVARSQVLAVGADEAAWWLVPASLHAPIEQQAVLLSDRPAGRAFLAFLRADGAREVLERHGYEVPRAEESDARLGGAE